jgi:acyl dehydratase
VLPQCLRGGLLHDNRRQATSTPSREIIRTVKYAEDLTAGLVIELGEYRASEDEMVGFARQWDPQPFHTDPAAAAGGYFGGVIASGLYTMGVLQRLAVLAAYRDWAVIAGRQIREVRMLAPVRPGAVLAGRLTIDEVTPAKPDRSLVVTTGELRAQDTVVLRAIFEFYLRRRAAG